MKKALAITPFFVELNRLSFLKLETREIVQGKKFKLFLRVENIGTKALKRITLKKINIKPENSHNIIHSFDTEILIDCLNPGCKDEYFISDFGTYMHGLTVMSLKIDSEGEEIEVFQTNHFDSQEEKSFKNEWFDAFYIETRNNNLQKQTNSALMGFTILMFLLAISEAAIWFGDYQHARQLIDYCSDNSDAIVYKNFLATEITNCEDVVMLK